MSLAESFSILNNATDRLKNAQNSEVALKLAQVLSKNPDLKYLRAFVNKDADMIAMCPQFRKMSPSEIANFAFASIVSCEVERSFSRYKSTLQDNRRSFEIDNLKKHLIVQSFSK